MPERIINCAAAILEATEQCMARDHSVFLMGEGASDPKGIFGTTLGLHEKYGRTRVIEMPIAENGLTGIAIGAAMNGQRPIMVHQRVDFALLALEQLYNNAGKSYYASNGLHKVPLVVRMIVGRGWGQGPAHSQSIDSVLAYAPGLKVVVPSTPREAKGLLAAAVEDDNPVMFIEHRWVHYATGDVPADYYTTPLSGPRVVRDGSDITVVANSYNLFETLVAAEYLAKAGISVEVVDLMVVRPLVMEPILRSVRKTGRLINVDTGWKLFGVGAEILAQVSEQAFGALRAPPVRLALADHPTPSSRELVRNYYPTTVSIFDAVIATVAPDNAQAASLRAELVRERERLPSDVPHPAFRGPF